MTPDQWRIYFAFREAFLEFPDMRIHTYRRTDEDTGHTYTYIVTEWRLRDGTRLGASERIHDEDMRFRPWALPHRARNMVRHWEAHLERRKHVRT